MDKGPWKIRSNAGYCISAMVSFTLPPFVGYPLKTHLVPFRCAFMTWILWSQIYYQSYKVFSPPRAILVF